MKRLLTGTLVGVLFLTACGDEEQDEAANSHQNTEPQEEAENNNMELGFIDKKTIVGFNQVDQRLVSPVSTKRNHIPKKSLDYQTLLEVFMSDMDLGRLSSLF